MRLLISAFILASASQFGIAAFSPPFAVIGHRNHARRHDSAVRQQVSAATVSSSPLSSATIATPERMDTATTTIEPSSALRPVLPSHDDWIATLDYQGFAKEVTSLGKELLQDSGPADVEHLNKIVLWRNLCALVGIATMWLPLNPISVLALSTWTYSSWTMIAHHTCHGGYNRVMNTGDKYTSRGFALGSVWRRVADWCDWMQPEAWNIEHNRLHHYHLGETKDPDLVQRNLEFMRESSIPLAIRYLAVGALIPIWKWFYYAPNTYKELCINERKKQGIPLPDDFDPTEAITVLSLLFPKAHQRTVREVVKPMDLLLKVWGPFFVSRFVLLPLPLLAIPTVGTTLFGHAIMNLVLAELLTNIHGFITIVTNHAGEDVYAFDDQVKPKTGAFYVRQIVGSVNYPGGTDGLDFMHGFLNYQIEHHVWPDLSMLQYQKGAPKLQAICDKYGVPYVNENVWERLRKTVDIMVGKTSMRPFPTHYEPIQDKGRVMWKTTNGAIDEE
jgi:fatty acid desaturase